MSPASHSSGPGSLALDREILAARGPKRPVDPRRPYGFHVEDELAASGRVEPVVTIFLVGRECPFRCLMCDLWQYTLDGPTPAGSLIEQLDAALEQLPPARHVKLYNASNFFDPLAVPRGDWPGLARRLERFETVIVENHPRLAGPACLEFRDLLSGRLEVAMGLETIHPTILPRLNKRMTLDDFDRAVEFLARHEIATRAFILLRPPGLDEGEGLEWAVRSAEHALGRGVGCCTVIPTRLGNGMLERLSARGEFTEPTLASLERVLERMLPDPRGRLFVDLWDALRFSRCERCAPARLARLERMNRTQTPQPAVRCACEAAPGRPDSPGPAGQEAAP